MNNGDFDCGITFYPKALTKVKQINWGRKHISRSCEKPKCIPSNDQQNCSLISSIPLLPFWTRTIYETWIQQLLHYSTTLLISTLRQIGTLKQQLANLEQYWNRYFLPCVKWTVKGRDCTSVLHFSKHITYRTDAWTKQVKIWVTSGNQEQWMAFHRSWWAVVFKRSYLF